MPWDRRWLGLTICAVWANKCVSSCRHLVLTSCVGYPVHEMCFIFRTDDMRPMATKFIQEADLICLLDFNALHRLQDMAQVVERSKAKRLMIDHHEDRTEKAADFIISHPKASSTCELVFKLIFQLGAFDELSRNAAACIYCGMMTTRRICLCVERSRRFLSSSPTCSPKN